MSFSYFCWGDAFLRDSKDRLGVSWGRLEAIYPQEVCLQNGDLWRDNLLGKDRAPSKLQGNQAPLFVIWAHESCSEDVRTALGGPCVDGNAELQHGASISCYRWQVGLKSKSKLQSCKAGSHFPKSISCPQHFKECPIHSSVCLAVYVWTNLIREVVP